MLLTGKGKILFDFDLAVTPDGFLLSVAPGLAPALIQQLDGFLFLRHTFPTTMSIADAFEQMTQHARSKTGMINGEIREKPLMLPSLAVAQSRSFLDLHQPEPFVDLGEVRARHEDPFAVRGEDEAGRRGSFRNSVEAGVDRTEQPVVEHHHAASRPGGVGYEAERDDAVFGPIDGECVAAGHAGGDPGASGTDLDAGLIEDRTKIGRAHV